MEHLGKTGKISALSKGMRDVAPEDRPEAGKLLSELRRWAEENFDALEATLKKRELEKKYASEKLDVTMPARFSGTGSAHPVTLVKNELIDIFSGMGFDVFEGPEIERDYYNFQALNIPADHPRARYAGHLLCDKRISSAFADIVRADPRHGTAQAAYQGVESRPRLPFRFGRDAFAHVPPDGRAGRWTRT